MKKNDSPPDLMTLRKAHRALPKVSYGTVWKWAQLGHLPTIKIGPKVFVLREQFEKLFQQRSQNREVTNVSKKARTGA
jgi:hypothetical protein